MKFKVQNIVGKIILIITCQISFIIAIEVYHLDHHSQAVIKKTKTRSSYINNEFNLFLSKLFNTKETSEIFIRHLRQVDLNNAINQDIDKLNNQITNFTKIMNMNNMQSNSNFTFGQPNSSGKFANMNNEIKKVKEDIEKIKNTSNVPNSSKLKLRALEQSIETLQKLFDDKNREFETRMRIVESFMDNLTNTVSNIRQELDQLSLHLLPTEIIGDIKGRDFGNAVRKIQQLPNLERQVNFVVHEVYNNNKGNFDLILKFANSSDTVELLSLIYDALVNELDNEIERKGLIAKMYETTMKRLMIILKF